MGKTTWKMKGLKEIMEGRDTKKEKVMMKNQMNKYFGNLNYFHFC